MPKWDVGKSCDLFEKPVELKIEDLKVRPQREKKKSLDDILAEMIEDLKLESDD